MINKDNTKTIGLIKKASKKAARKGFNNGFINIIGLKIINDVNNPDHQPKHMEQENKYPKKFGLILQKYSRKLLNILLFVTIRVIPKLTIIKIRINIRVII